MSEKAVAKLWAESSHDALCKILEDTPQSVLRTYAPNTLSWLGVAASLRGNYKLARVPLTLALMKDPSSLDHSLNLGNCLRLLGEHQAALDVFNKGLQKKFDAELFAGACACALELKQGGDLILLGEAFVKFKPGDPRAHYYFGNALQSFERYTEAITHLKRSLELDATNVSAARILAISLLRSNLIPQANDVVSQIISSGQYDDKFMMEVTSITVEMGGSIVALAWYERVKNLASISLKFLVSEIFRFTGELEQALEMNEEVLGSEPRHLAALLSNISILRQQGRFEEARFAEEAVRTYNFSQMPLEFIPNPWASFSVTPDASFQLKVARKWGDKNFNNIDREKIWAAPSRGGALPRVGFFSPDFGDHPVGNIVKKLFAASDGLAEIVCFSARAREDEVTEAIKHQSSDFFPIFGKSHHEIRRLVQTSGTDVIVDLAAYTTGGAPGLFAKGLCARQISYLGYSGTTGANCYDHVVLDRYILAGARHAAYSEDVICLDYPIMLPGLEDTTTLGARGKAEYGIDADAVLFACLAGLYKISAEIIEAWVVVLKSVPNSYLLLGPANGALRGRILEAFARGGIVMERVIFANHEPTRAEHLSRLKGVDVFLDTFPYNAHSLAADAISAGVPVVTIAGATYASRVAGSLMAYFGLESLVTSDFKGYASVAIKLGNNPERLERVKQALAKKVSGALSSRAHFIDFFEKIFGRSAA